MHASSHPLERRHLAVELVDVLPASGPRPCSMSRLGAQTRRLPAATDSIRVAVSASHSSSLGWTRTRCSAIRARNSARSLWHGAAPSFRPQVCSNLVESSHALLSDCCCSWRGSDARLCLAFGAHVGPILCMCLQ
eukprot:1687486-Rhodomonas_salina.1